MKKSIIFPLLLIASASLAQKTNKAADTRLTGLDGTFNQVLKDWHAAGFAVAVVEKNKIIYARGFGYRDLDKKLPVNPQTLFAIGSCTKAFTATLIGLLQKEDKVNLDQPATSYLKELKFSSNTLNNQVTLRDMLCHRTGLPRYDFSWYLFQTRDKDSLIQRIQYFKPTAPLRSQWQYNNYMYLTLGVIDEKLTGHTWEQNIQQQLLTPLEMTHSNLSVRDLEKSPDASLGYMVKKDSTIQQMDYYDIEAMSPAGAINSNVQDMSNWVMAWINNGTFNGKEIIPPSFQSQAISSQSIIGPALPGKGKPGLYFSNYGFGWMLSSYKGHYRVEHGGNIDGFTASTCFFPTDSIGIIVLCNQNNSLVPAIIRNTIADRMLGLKKFDWSSDLKKEEGNQLPPKDSVEKSKVPRRDLPATHPGKDYTGHYNNPAYGTLEVFIHKDSLFMKLGRITCWMRHNNFDVFDLFGQDPRNGIDTTQGGGLPAQFQLNTSGDIETVSLQFEPNMSPVVFQKKLEVKAVSKEQLKKYTGNYEISGTLTKVFLKNDSTLYLLVPGQPEYELIPVSDDKFAIKSHSGFFVQFASDEKNKVTSVTFIQPNGDFKAPKK